MIDCANGKALGGIDFCKCLDSFVTVRAESPIYFAGCTDIFFPKSYLSSGCSVQECYIEYVIFGQCLPRMLLQDVVF
eukprot:UN16824